MNLAVKNSDRNTAMSIKGNEILMQKSVFPKPPSNFVKPPVTSFGLVYTKIIKEVVA